MKAYGGNGVVPSINSITTEGAWKISHSGLFALRYGASYSLGMEGYVNPRAGLDTLEKKKKKHFSPCQESNGYLSAVQTVS
jgi:hypothetical protein